MSSYSNITPRIVDSVFDRANLRAEYRLQPDQVYLSTMRICNVGFTASGPCGYNGLLGAYGAIRQISLFDGSQLLEQVRLAPEILSFKNAGVRNDENISMNRQLKKIKTGYVATGYGAVSAHPELDDDKVEVTTQEPFPFPGGNNAGEASWLSLKDVFSFLERSIIVPTGIFKQFRIVIEYNSDSRLKELATENNLTMSTLTSGILLVDEVNQGATRDVMMKNYQGVVYRPLEVDTVYVPPIAGLADSALDKSKSQSNNFLVTGFNNKRVMRLALIQGATDATTWKSGTTNTGFGPVSSMSQFLQQLQVRVNGSNKLSGKGIASAELNHSTANRRLAYLLDSWGEYNLIPGQQAVNFEDWDECVEDDSLRGTQDYLGLAINETVQELQVQYGRLGHFGDVQTSQALNLHMVGEVERAVILNGDGYNVVYA